MSASQIFWFAVALVSAASAAAAQTPAVPSASGLEPGAMQPVMDQAIFAHAIFNQLEGRWNGSNTEFRWDGQGWVGTDYDKLWIKSEGTLSNGAVDDGQQQFLYSRAVTTYFDLQGGLRSDIDSRLTRNWAAIGIQGLAPYFFDLEVTGFVSGEGHLAAKLEASYDVLITQRLILQPQSSSMSTIRPIRHAWSAPVFPTSIPVSGCATSSIGNSRPTLASSIRGNLARPRILRGKRAKAPETSVSSSAFEPGFEGSGNAHCDRFPAHGRPRCAARRRRTDLRRPL